MFNLLVIKLSLPNCQLPNWSSQKSVRHLYIYLMQIMISFGMLFRISIFLGQDERPVRREQGVPRPSQEESREEGQRPSGGKQGADILRQGQGRRHRPQCQAEHEQP